MSFQFKRKDTVIVDFERLVKLVVKGKAPFGAYLIGFHSTELISEYMLAVRKGLTVEDVVDIVHLHPTLSETVIVSYEPYSCNPL